MTASGFRVNNDAMPDSCARIFLLSHMRACTSLAGHILGSHPQINGYFELQIGYEDAAAFDRQLAVYTQYETLKPAGRYLFDKLLHNEYALDTARTGDVECRLLVALQEPRRTISSIIELFARKGPDELYATPQGAAGYYMERLRWLAGFCQVARQPYCYYDAELFQVAPERLLGKLTQWLALDPPLSEQYQVFSQTGVPGKGDSSPLIRSGRIATTRVDYAHVQVPEELLQRAQAVYRECRAVLIEHAVDALIVS
jgi:hypothetical protein